MGFLWSISRKKKKVFSLLSLFALLLSLPISAYFVISDESFDRRSEAAIFNSLVSEMEMEIQESEGEYELGVIILEFPEHVSSEEIERITGKPRSTPEVLKDTPFERFEYVEVPLHEKAREMAKYKRYMPTKNVSLDYLGEVFWQEDGDERVLPQDWNNSNHWYFDNIGLPEAWKMQGCKEGNELCGGSEDVVVAVIDTGLAFNASEVDGHMNVYKPSDYAQSGFNGSDDFGHGTYVAGIIASATNNSSNGPVGLAHDVSILSLKVNRPYEGRINFMNVSAAIFYATKSGANVINLSLGTNGSHNNVLSSAIEDAVDNGVVVVAASGNSSVGRLAYPASDSRVIAVGAVNPDNTRSSYSQYGSGLDFVAPVGQARSSGNATWQQTLSCMPNCNSSSNLNSFSNMYSLGTSYAAPQIAGAAGLILSLDPSLSPSGVKNVLIETVEDIGSRSEFGYGLLNLKNIYEYFEIRPEPSLEFDVSSEEIRYGQGTILTWSAPEASYCEANNGWTGTKEISGAEKVFPEVDTIYELTCFVEFLDREISSVSASIAVKVEKCQVSDDCSREVPYEVCFNETCMKGDINDSGSVSMADFDKFKQDYILFNTGGWDDNLKRSDLNMDGKVSMEDYSMFVGVYRLVNRLY